MTVIPSAAFRRRIPMTRHIALIAALTVPLSAATITVSKPEASGMSSERLARIGPLIQSHIAAKDLSGAVTLVARRGKVVHFEAHGLADVEANRPMKTTRRSGWRR
jgi:Beta-lactamase.